MVNQPLPSLLHADSPSRRCSLSGIRDDHLRYRVLRSRRRPTHRLHWRLTRSSRLFRLNGT